VRTLALIPARGGSRRLHRKNMSILEGRTLVRRALETALAASCFETVALSSDDAEILAEAAGLEVVQIERPQALAADETPTFDVVVHALGWIERELGRLFDAVGVVQATSPFTAPEDLAGAVAMLADTGAPSVVSIVRLEGGLHPLKLKVLEGDRLRPYLGEDGLRRAQDLPSVWMRNGSVYLSRREVIAGGALLDPDDVRGYAMPAERSLDIDTPRDLAFAEFLAGRRKAGPTE